MSLTSLMEIANPISANSTMHFFHSFNSFFVNTGLHPWPVDITFCLCSVIYNCMVDFGIEYFSDSFCTLVPIV